MGSNPVEGMAVRLFCLLCSIGSGLCNGADGTSRSVIPGACVGVSNCVLFRNLKTEAA